MSNKNLTIGLIVVGIIAIIGVFTPLGQSLTASFGSVGGKLIEQYDPYVRYNGGVNTALPFKTTSTMQIGSNGTAYSNSIITTCAMNGNLSITATSTGYESCTGVTGLTSSDNVIAQFASTTGTTAIGDNWVIVGAKASTTAGAVDITVMNLTGKSQALSASSKIGSTTTLFIAH